MSSEQIASTQNNADCKFIPQWGGICIVIVSLQCPWNKRKLKSAKRGIPTKGPRIQIIHTHVGFKKGPTTAGRGYNFSGVIPFCERKTPWITPACTHLRTYVLVLWPAFFFLSFFLLLARLLDLSEQKTREKNAATACGLFQLWDLNYIRFPQPPLSDTLFTIHFYLLSRLSSPRSLSLFIYLSDCNTFIRFFSLFSPRKSIE